MANSLLLGVSSCLLGNQVRFDGGHQHDKFITKTLSDYAEFYAVCPEVECGLPVPRESMRLVGEIDSPNLIGNKTGTDYTAQMKNWISTKLDELATLPLDGFIFKRASPSSGMARVKVYSEKGVPVQKGVGLFAKAFMERFPNLPVEEDGRLNDPILRENFIQRIFAYRRLHELRETNKSSGGLVQFHTNHKMVVLSHDEQAYKKLGQMVAKSGTLDTDELFEDYESLFMEALKKQATVKKHTNVLMHAMGYFKKQLSSDEKQELLSVIDNYHDHLLPLVVPLTLLNHYVRKYQEPYLTNQVYLHPHPLKLKLLNHA